MPLEPPATSGESTRVHRRTVVRSSATIGIGIVTLAGCSEDTEPGVEAGEEATPTSSPTAGGQTQTDTSSPTDDTETSEETGSTDEPADDPEEEGPEESDTWVIRPDGDPRQIPANWTCDDDEARREPQQFDEDLLSWGDDPDGRWELRITDTAFEHGARIHVRLRNVSDDEQGTGNRGKYNLQIQTDDGWEDVRVWRDGQPQPHPDELVVHDPGEGFDWRFSMAEDEFEDRKRTVCPELETGRYRFAFEYTDGKGIAVGFDLDVS